MHNAAGGSACACYFCPSADARDRHASATNTTYGSGFLHEAVLCCLISTGELRLQVDVSGGFYEDGPWGPIKLTKSNALSTSILAWTLLDAEDAMRKEEPTLVR